MHTITLKLVSLNDIADEYALFTNADTVTGLENLTVVVSDNAGNNETMTLSVGKDGSISAVTVPEPTTATLSLLALAGLAVRRRRR